MFTYLTSTTICLHTPTYLTHIPLLSRNVPKAKSCNLLLLLKWVSLSVIHKTLHPLISKSLVAVWGLILVPIWWLFWNKRWYFTWERRFLVAFSSSLQHCALVLLLCLYLIWSVLQRDDEAKFQVRWGFWLALGKTERAHWFCVGRGGRTGSDRLSGLCFYK